MEHLSMEVGRAFVHRFSGARRAIGGQTQQCASKGIRREGIVLKHRNSLQKSLCPVVIRPYLCSSDRPAWQAADSAAAAPGSPGGAATARTLLGGPYHCVSYHH